MSSWRWKCGECDKISLEGEMLRAPSPFNPAHTLIACPNCSYVSDMINICDEPGCDAMAGCGWPSPSGYRRTCGRHMENLPQQGETAGDVP